jgi:hypothetical protein
MIKKVKKEWRFSTPITDRQSLLHNFILFLELFRRIRAQQKHVHFSIPELNFSRNKILFCPRLGISKQNSKMVQQWNNAFINVP